MWDLTKEAEAEILKGVSPLLFGRVDLDREKNKEKGNGSLMELEHVEIKIL